MDSILACITTRDGNPPTLVREKVEAACRHVAASRLAGVQLSIQENAYSVCYARNQAVADMLAGDFSHLFFCDDDVHLPEKCITELLRTNKPVVGGCYPSIKTNAPGDLDAAPYVVVKHQGQWLKNWFKGSMRVQAVGTGCVLIRRAVFDKVSFPWFRWGEYWTPGIAELQQQSDDLDFCTRADEAGFQVWANGDIRCGHVKPVDISNFIKER